MPLLPAKITLRTVTVCYLKGDGFRALDAVGFLLPRVAQVFASDLENRFPMISIVSQHLLERKGMFAQV